jgi:acetate kinase
VKILVLNSGSSSQKACLFEVERELPVQAPAYLWEGKIEWHGDRAVISVNIAGQEGRKSEVNGASRERVLREMLSRSPYSDIEAAGHRIVHGGPHFEEPVLITPEVRNAIAAVSAFAPLHIEAELEGIKTVENLMGSLPQIAVFDTGFHRQIPLPAAVYPGPYEWFESGIRRYGFHGINHQYCTERAAQLLGRDKTQLKMVSCHLGNGCSLAAIQGGRSVDTTMGFTPLDGLMMGTRSGAIDPGILTYLMREEKLNANEIDSLLNRSSGLLGVSGISGDMRDIRAATDQGHERAKLAFQIYVHRLRAAIAAMAAAMGGINVLVFTGGVGENSPEVRADACSGLEFLGIQLDAQKNTAPTLDADISTPASPVRILVIRAQEDWAIAKQCWTLLQPASRYR